MVFHPSPPPSPVDLIPNFDEISPLKEEKVSISAVKAPLNQVLYAIANDLDMNLVISPDVNITQRITLNLKNVVAYDALNIIKELAGVSFQEENNILYVKSMETKIFYIPYLQSLSSYNVDLGGDVLGSINTGGEGSGGTGGSSGGSGGSGSSGNTLKGEFSLKYKKNNKLGDFYSQFEDNIKNILSKDGKYTLNRITGTLIVTDKIKNIKKIGEFLKKIKKELYKEVLIEAKVVEVYLNNDWSYGIDWSSLLSHSKLYGSHTKITLSQNLALSNSVGQVLVAGTHFNALLNVLSEVGKVKTLSSPRIRVLNGQNALITTGTVVPYWEKQIDTLASTSASQQTVTYTRSSVLDGILLGVSAFVNEDGTITLNIIPVSTRIKGEKQLLDNNQVVAQAPIIELKEAGTIVRVKDGNTVIIGGLINNDKKINEKKIPLLSDIPIIGNLFKQKSVSNQKKELIIFLRPHIVEGVK